MPASLTRIACVNPGLGSNHFRRHIQPHLLTQHFVREAGHLDVIGEPSIPLIAPLIKASCAQGTRPRAIIEAEVLGFFGEYINKMFGASDKR